MLVVAFERHNVFDASDSALMSMMALRDVGLGGVVYQESFGPDARLAVENFEKLKLRQELRANETTLVRAGVSPHAPYTVCGPQLEMIADFALAENLPLMMHAAESEAGRALLREGWCVCGRSGAALDRMEGAGVSTIQYLKQHGIRTLVLCSPTASASAMDIETLRHGRGLRTARSPTRNWATVARRWRSSSKRELSWAWVATQWRAITRATFSKKRASRRY